MSMADDLTQSKLKELFDYDSSLVAFEAREKYHGSFVNHGGI